MRFALPILSILVASAAASPASLVAKRDAAQAEALQFAVEAADCNIGDCVNVVASAVCIAAGIVARSVSTVTGCVSGGAGSVSPLYRALVHS